MPKWGSLQHRSFMVPRRASVANCSELPVLCPKVYGVVLVPNSGKTWQQVALRTKKEAEEAGAGVHGVVLAREILHSELVIPITLNDKKA